MARRLNIVNKFKGLSTGTVYERIFNLPNEPIMAMSIRDLSDAGSDVAWLRTS